MKKTTYMMLGAMVAGLIGVVAITGTYMRNNMVEVTKHTLGGEKVNIQLEDAHKVIYDDYEHGCVLKIENYKGLAVLESDTARVTTLRASAGCMPYLDCRSDSGELTVKVDYEALVKEYVDSGMPRRSVRLVLDDFVIATVIMPRGTLREVAARDKTVYLDSVVADEIKSKVDDRLVLNNSHIKLLNSRAKRIRELKLDNSTVGEADLRAVDSNFRVTCSETSVIDKMYIDSVYRNPRRAFFKFEKANIRDFKFNPEIDMLLNVEMKSGNSKF